MHAWLVKSLAVVGLVGFSSSAVNAEPFAGAYFSLQGGVSLLDDAENTGDPFIEFRPDTRIESEYDAGFMVGATVGYGSSTPIFKSRFGPLYARYELEFAYREHGLDSLTIKNDGGLGELIDTTFGTSFGSLNGLSGSVPGEVQSASFMYNIWVDIDTKTPFLPYIGGGIGVSSIWIDDVKLSDPELVVTLVDDQDTVFAYQLGAGLGYRLTPWLMLSLDYRWFETIDPEFEFELTGNDFESEFRTHNVGVSLRYQF